MLSTIALAVILALIVIVIVFAILPYVPVDENIKGLIRAVTVILSLGYVLLKVLGFM